MSESVILFLIGQCLTAAGIYSAIRADLREYKVRIGALEKNGCEHRHGCRVSHHG